MMELPRYHRLRGAYYRLEGSACSACDRRFFPPRPVCPSCKGQDLERLLSHVSVSSEHTRKLPFDKARSKAKLVQRDKDVAQAEYEKHHREEH